MRLFSLVAASATLLAVSPALHAQSPAPAPTGTAPVRGLSYADLVELTLASPIVAGATITRASRLKGADAANVPPGTARFYVEATVETLLRGRNGLSTAVTYLADVPLDARGKAPKLKKMRVLLLAQPVPGQPASLRLSAPQAQLDWTPEAEARLRDIIRAIVAPDAPPAVTGIANAFHVPGSLPGESETQIFLATAANRPISLAVLRKPQEQPRWAVALGEMVDEAAAPPARDTLLWYRLACGLPARLPDSALASLSPGDAAAARTDYQVIKAGLGPCTRSLRR
ncbi:hypothetical protein [Sphingomonas jatrophae]|uniref:Uncharacterized protein n=1 Tax=Sphingomonas jatrophae TaxID=1166337 RepID=A0A1I6M620_9SPHN|nr:hypothetical protein [Sphingomonas jatrophae]SFS11111.1 hypothetical protein SAMN05192580_3526 [Sphingomonas jatrophae]